MSERFEPVGSAPLEPHPKLGGIRGTRILLSVVLDCMAAGLRDAEILRQYPTRTVDGIRAAAYGAASASDS